MIDFAEDVHKTVEERGKKYGHPLENFTRIAGMWREVLSVDITPEQVALCMIAVKISRECSNHHPDNMRDVAGYAQTLLMCKGSTDDDELEELEEDTHRL